MQVTAHRVGALDYAVIDGLFPPEELNEVENEVAHIINSGMLQYPEATFSAKAADGRTLKTGRGLLLNEYYSPEWQNAGILYLVTKISTPEIVDRLRKTSANYTHLKNANSRTTLLNVYANNEGYLGHYDGTLFTAVTFIGEDEFSGGDLVFPEFNVREKSIRNKTVVFPGCVLHEVESVQAQEGQYRKTLTQFLNYKERP
jgi:hypothetical protein